MKSILALQNGSDIRGVAIEGIEGQDVNLTADIVADIAESFVIWLSNKLSKDASSLKISIGRDSRITGELLQNAAIGRLHHIIHAVYDCSLASTPSMFMSTQFEQMDCDGAIMLTASHLPFNRNGMKFFTKEGGLGKKDIRQILELCSEKKSFSSNKDSYKKNNPHGSKLHDFKLLSLYSEYLVNYIRSEVKHPTNFEQPLSGLKIIVDAGNGAGGFFADKVLKPLGADITGSQFLEPDGHFPNHIPNPENDEAMAAIQKATIDTKADLGIIFDTDVDRAAIVDKSGNIINRNRLIALLSAIILEEYPHTTIVTDSVTSDGLSSFIQKHGGHHHRFKRGYKNVIDESIRLNEEGTHSALAIETSGHGALKDNYFLDDGAFLVTKILVALSKKHAQGETLTDCLKDLDEPAESAEIRIPILSENFVESASPVLEAFEKFSTVYTDYEKVTPNYEGVRLSANTENRSGWFLIRLSLHDPILPLQIEANKKSNLKEIAQDIYNFLLQLTESQNIQLDLSVFKPYV